MINHRSYQLGEQLIGGKNIFFQCRIQLRTTPRQISMTVPNISKISSGFLRNSFENHLKLPYNFPLILPKITLKISQFPPICFLKSLCGVFPVFFRSFSTILSQFFLISLILLKLFHINCLKFLHNINSINFKYFNFSQ